MYRHSSHSRPQAAFTLTELLAVIAIIGVLVALAIAGLGAIRALANQSVCTSNLRQWGIALQLNLAEKRGRMPYEGGEDERTWGQVSDSIQNEGSSWYNALPPYIDATPLTELVARGRAFTTAEKNALFADKNRIYRDAADERATSSTVWNTYISPAYMMNSQFYNNDRPNNSDLAGNVRPLFVNELPQSLPLSSIAFMTDGGVVGNGTAARPRIRGHADSVDCRHLGGANVVFLDGSVRKFSEAQLRDPAYKNKEYNRPGLIWNPWITN